MVAPSPEPEAHVLNVRAFRIEWEFRRVGILGEGKTGVPAEKRSREENQQQIQPTHDAESENRIPGHIGGGRVLSPLRHPCFPTPLLFIDSY